jgi:hypothetical protein
MPIFDLSREILRGGVKPGLALENRHHHTLPEGSPLKSGVTAGPRGKDADAGQKGHKGSQCPASTWLPRVSQYALKAPDTPWQEQ